MEHSKHTKGQDSGYSIVYRKDKNHTYKSSDAQSVYGITKTGSVRSLKSLSNNNVNNGQDPSKHAPQNSDANSVIYGVTKKDKSQYDADNPHPQSILSSARSSRVNSVRMLKLGKSRSIRDSIHSNGSEVASQIGSIARMRGASDAESVIIYEDEEIKDTEIPKFREDNNSGLITINESVHANNHNHIQSSVV